MVPGDGVEGARLVTRRLYHVTPHADAILREGFRDGEGSYGIAGTILRGVFLSDSPVGVEEAQGDTLSVDLPDDLALDGYEIVEASAPPGWRREWIIPAAVINERGITLLYERDTWSERPDWATGV